MRETIAIIKYNGVAIEIIIIDVTNMNIFCMACCMFVDKLLSKSSWSLVVLVSILPVGVTSNQDSGDRNNI